jgi:hypothetical protein
MKLEKSRLEPLKVELGGVEYPVRVTNGGMIELEELTGKPFSEIFESFIGNKFSVKEVRAALFIMLKGGGVELAIEDLDDIEFSIDCIGVMSDALLKANRVTSILEEQNSEKDGDGKKGKPGKA